MAMRQGKLDGVGKFKSEAESPETMNDVNLEGTTPFSKK